MLALRFENFGKPSDVLHLSQEEPPELAPGLVRVDVKLRPINPSDLFQIRGKYGYLPELPAIPGMEGLGIVNAVSPGVEGLSHGQRVVFLNTQGTWAETVTVPSSALVPVPEGIADEAAAQVIVNPLTAYAMVKELSIPDGAWVVLTAATSAVGHCLLDLAKRQGFRALCLVRDPLRIPELLASGAEVALSTQAPGWQEEAASHLGQGAYAILDAVGGQQAASLFTMLRPGGTYLVYGALSMQPLQLPGGQIIYRYGTVRGFHLTAWKRSVGPDHFLTTMAELFDLQSQGLMCPPVEAVFPLEEAIQAAKCAEMPGRKGKILLRS
jgi:NADPH2:quinone reductase